MADSMEIMHKFVAAAGDLYPTFKSKFADKGNAATQAFHSKPSLHDRFTVPAHTYANLYLMAVALRMPLAVQETILTGFREEVERQGKDLDWQQIRADTLDVCETYLWNASNGPDGPAA